MTVRLFVYGTLQPGASHWRLLEPFVAGPPRPAGLPGALYDTGRGYPALRLDSASGESSGSGSVVSGWLVELAEPSDAALAAVDRYEGPEYRRVLVTVAGGVRCWTYVWIRNFAGLRRLTRPWHDLPRSTGHGGGTQGTLGG